MANDIQLQAEARERPRMAIVAGAAALLTLAAAVIGIVTLSNEPSNLPGSLLFRNAHQTGLALSAAASLVSSIAIAFVLDFLYRAAKARNDAVPPWVRIAVWVGGVGLALVGAVIQVVLAIKLAHFASSGTQTYDEAKKVLTASDYDIPRYLGIVPQLALAAGLVMVSLHAMRVGLLTRFLGYLGVIAAVLFVLPLVPIPIVQVYWLAALAWLLAGRMSNGDPPAWASGKAEPWPSTQELREARVRQAEARQAGRGGNSSAGDDLVEGAEAPPAEPPARAAAGAGAGAPGAARRKRKKKR